MMAVTATEYKINFGREDMFLNPNGKTTAKVMSPQISTVDSSGDVKKYPFCYGYRFFLRGGVAKL